ncbi:MAG: DUF3187 family protein, partial [Acidobacteriota bacterium]
MSMRRPLLGLLLVAILSPNPARGDDDDSWRKPLASRNQFPLALLFVSLEPERAGVLAKGEQALLFDFGYSNIITLQSREEESLTLDLEYLRSVFRFDAGLGRGFEVSTSFPVYLMYGGFLDGFIS